jgi:putative endonuclease
MKRGRDALRVGRKWEASAAEFLKAQGVTIIARGYRCRLGELDLIGKDERGLIVIEVRARRDHEHGSALESVVPAKRQRMVRATRHFLMRNPSWNARPIRFDIIAIDAIESAAPVMTWVKNAFDAT